MTAQLKIILPTLVLCFALLAGTACETSTAGGREKVGLSLHVILVKASSNRPLLDMRVADDATAKRLYTAAVTLPPAPHGLYGCPAGDGAVYHLTFSGGTVTEHEMDVQASGCRFVFIGRSREVHQMTDEFVSQFTTVLGIRSLDPFLPVNPGNP